MELPFELYLKIVEYLPDHIIFSLWNTGRELHSCDSLYNHRILPHLRILQWHQICLFRTRGYAINNYIFRTQTYIIDLPYECLRFGNVLEFRNNTVFGFLDSAQIVFQFIEGATYVRLHKSVYRIISLAGFQWILSTCK